MNPTLNRMKGKARSLIVQHRTAVLAGATTFVGAALEALPAKADIVTDMSNGTAIIQAGISVAQTPPLGYIVDGFAVAIGALAFVKIVRRFF